MNVRIKELIEQCTTHYNGGLGTEIEVFDKEKFAELIVRECYALVDYENKQFIKAHFGVEDTFKVGSRIKVISGFNVGAKGTVSYIEPTGRMWVRRDGAGSDVFYHPEEVIGVRE